VIVFIGLGNVGEKFKDTKHNAGFWVLDEMANRHNISFKPAQGDYVVASKPDKFFLIKPTTGMNRSGIAVKEIMDSKNMLTNQKLYKFDLLTYFLNPLSLLPQSHFDSSL
jgi:PTH1 family peptidyl-tRNA hydrolase